MALMALTAAYLNVSGPGDVSNRCSKIELVTDVDELDTTTFGSNGWKEVLGGLKSASLSLSFKNDLADDGLDEDLDAINGNVVNAIVKASSDATSASNPEWRFSVLVKGLAPVRGSVGQLNEFDVTWPVSGAVTRTTTSA